VPAARHGVRFGQIFPCARISDWWGVYVEHRAEVAVVLLALVLVALVVGVGTLLVLP
jgi:hypothetical protein